MAPDRFDAILAAMPGTRRDIQAKLGITKGALQNLLERLHKAGWCHVCGWERAIINDTVKFLRVMGAGPGQDAACDLEPMTQKERDERRYKKLVATGAIVKRVKARVDRERAKREKRKKLLAAWAAPLTVKIAKRKPANTFPAAVELENA